MHDHISISGSASAASVDDWVQDEKRRFVAPLDLVNQLGYQRKSEAKQVR